MLRKISSIILFSLLLIGCQPKEKNSYELSKGSQLPVADFRINDIWASFLIDTGAEKSILNKRFLTKNIISFAITDTTYIESITAQGIEKIEVYNTKGIINDTIPVFFLVNDIDNVMISLSQESGRNVVGILGYDFIKENKVIFDYDNKELLNFKTIE